MPAKNITQLWPKSNKLCIKFYTFRMNKPFYKTLLAKAVFFNLITFPYSNVVPNRPE